MRAENNTLSVDIKSIKNKNSNYLLLSDINIKLKKNVLWIKGENGTGKSLISSVISGIAFLPKSTIAVDGQISFCKDGIDYLATNNSNIQEYCSQVSYWPQKLGSSLVSIHQQDDLIFGLESRVKELKDNDIELRNELNDLLNELRLKKHLLKKYGQSSYGETRRVELGAALTTQPYLLIADEPFAGMDPKWKKTIIKLIHYSLSNHNTKWVITSHYDPVGELAEHCSVYNLASNIPSKHFFTQISNCVKSRMNNFPISINDHINIKNLKISRKRPYKFTQHYLNITIPPKSITYIQGENGSGKSTLMKYISGLSKNGVLKSYKWQGTIEGYPFINNNVRAPNGDIRILLQNPYDSFVSKNVYNDLLYIESPGVRNEYDIYSDIVDLVQVLEELVGPLQRPSISFSFGQLRFLQLLLIPPSVSVVIFDEPFLGMHDNLHKPTYEIIKSIADSGRAVVITSEPKDDYYMNTTYPLESERIYKI